MPAGRATKRQSGRVWIEGYAETVRRRSWRRLVEYAYSAFVRIMFLWKLPELCNGTRRKVKVSYRNIVEAIIFTGRAQRESVFVSRVPLVPNDLPFEFKRLLFPLKVRFAMTTNKSQRQTLKFEGIDLRENRFSHEQFGATCSRAILPYSLVVLASTNRSVKKIVHKKVS